MKKSPLFISESSIKESKTIPSETIIFCLLVGLILLISPKVIALILTATSILLIHLKIERDKRKNLVIKNQNNLSAKIVNLVERSVHVDIFSGKKDKLSSFQEQVAKIEQNLKEGLYPNFKKIDTKLKKISLQLISIEEEIKRKEFMN